jgi:pimeloyl-ACP methyl ester carboxylesterase
MSLETEQTRFVETSGIRFAYRSFGRKDGVLLVFLQHFTGTMDSWDPALVNALAETRPVIVFDNTGVGKSSGTTPDSVEQMTADAAAFTAALALEQVDLLGYSLGGSLPSFWLHKILRSCGDSSWRGRCREAARSTCWRS